MPAADQTLIAQIRAALREVADPSTAPQMQAYMRSATPYLGVPVPTVRRLTRAAERQRAPETVTALVATTRQLWRSAGYREERYAATALTDTARARRLRDLTLLPLYQEMIVTGAWWDHVDEVAHRVGELLTAYPTEMTPVVHDWSTAEDLWLRRCAIICQLQAKTGSDLELLTDVIAANLDDDNFFIRKAIGWALRDYARTDPAWMRAFVREHEEQLSPLSRREALKHL